VVTIYKQKTARIVRSAEGDVRKKQQQLQSLCLFLTHLLMMCMRLYY